MMTDQLPSLSNNTVRSISGGAIDATRLSIGYLVPEFPGQTHIMFWREVHALRQMGERVALLSTRRPSTPSPHDFAAAAGAETHYVFPPSLKTFSRWVGSGGTGVSGAMAYIRGLEAAGAKNRAKQAILLASAVELAFWADRQGIQHIHAHSCADAAHILALAHLIGGKPYSLTLHGDLDVYGVDHQSKMKNAAFVQVVGQHLRQQIEQHVHLPGLKIIETFMGVETTGAENFDVLRSGKEGQLNLVTVARLQFNKGHKHALAAIATGVQQGLDLRYSIVGDGPDRDTLVQLTAELGLSERVKFTGALSSNDVRRILSKADVFILPSTGTGEAWPVSVMEAMAAGTPVIATEIGATREMIRSGFDGFLVPQTDPAAIFEKLQLLAHNLDLRRAVGAAANETASRRFDVKISAGVLQHAIRGGL
jgi:glycosyltransferase involved in cell wall biosynthesis